MFQNYKIYVMKSIFLIILMFKKFKKKKKVFVEESIIY